MSVTIKLNDDGYSYTHQGKVYQIKTEGSVLMSDIPDEDMNKLMFQMALDNAVALIATDIATDLVKDFRKLFVKEVNAEVREYLTKNKKKIVGEMVKRAKKEAESKLEDVYDEY